MRMENAKNRLRSRAPKNDTARATTTSRIAAPTLIAVLTAAAFIVVVNVFQRSDPGIASVEAATSATLVAAPPAPPLDTTNASLQHVPTVAAAPMRTPDTSVMSRRVVESPHTTVVEPVQHPDAIPHATAIRHANPRLPADSAPIAKVAAPADFTPTAKPAPLAEPLTSATVINGGPVTISGCLQIGGDSFWLTDTTGANAPTSRSWKSGFLKKHAESVQVVAATEALQLSNYVAQRVTATGTLANRTMRARSLERAAGSCH